MYFLKVTSDISSALTLTTLCRNAVLWNPVSTLSYTRFIWRLYSMRRRWYWHIQYDLQRTQSS